ncbi:hypothetical protein SMAC4_07844 [Sordaria macrospora]|uniref:WGS project CABT00000000 data, contig 2.14 n=2 Tax=Sordaria macrospora TaxID=5147 RepID=F7VZ80_SORMK|nr:uncharacterized protein SMAC_07844 [Sordaria macrospora k-hell]WPJ59799.1 hypothetical protein SMAC4_07844 [Sordaria macrospora]CCC10827.1 unnamed protein product [Sordaria macrospora k-hell]
MAAPPPSPDTPITLKVAFEGATRRFKLPFRDLTASSLETKLREYLEIPAETNAIFERYSDSAATYITLDPANTSVYKQLFRAAKAKQKLKLRVTCMTAETPAQASTPEVHQDTTTGPKSASVEAEPTETEGETSASNPTSPVHEETPEVIKSIETGGKTVKTFDDLRVERSDIMTRVNKAMDRIEDLQNRLPFGRAASMASMPVSELSTRSGYAVCCNSCDQTIAYDHYHCSICDDGDFDLCPDCHNKGVVCHNYGHQLTKRFINNGSITTVDTKSREYTPMVDAAQLAQAKALEQRMAVAHVEYMAKLQEAEDQKAALQRTNEILALAKAESSRSSLSSASPSVSRYESVLPSVESYSRVTLRTCNCCISDLPEAEFVHCQTCDDFDLCKGCFARNRHGHHPKHAFSPLVPGTCMESDVRTRLAPGRNQLHHAICDGCEKDIRGVRHKCLQCPDWDYCSTCYESASFIHANHRFVPIYEPLEPAYICHVPRALTHVGVCCDGPLCNNNNRPGYTYIVGDRYKCAVCDDVDFCAKCEASPANTHNKTHPLIKFKTPVRNVNVTTTGEHENGRRMPAMGDRPRPCRRVTTSRATGTESFQPSVMTVVDVKPSEPAPAVKAENAESPAPLYVATYVRDKVVDGTVFGPDQVFEQTWVVRNDGPTPWPAGCFVKYLHGEYMGHVDPAHPTATGDLESCLQSNVCEQPVLPGQSVPFTVLLRSPSREGRHLSHWRVSTKQGLMIGHKLWCDIVVKKPETAPEEKVREAPAKVEDLEKNMAKLNIEPETNDAAPIDHSQVVFPKLDKESPSASVHQEDAQSQAESGPEEEDYEECEDAEWDESESYMTDEEYDILDASDEESVSASRK